MVNNLVLEKDQQSTSFLRRMLMCCFSSPSCSFVSSTFVSISRLISSSRDCTMSCTSSLPLEHNSVLVHIGERRNEDRAGQKERDGDGGDGLWVRSMQERLFIKLWLEPNYKRQTRQGMSFWLSYIVSALCLLPLPGLASRCLLIFEIPENVTSSMFPSFLYIIYYA